MRAATLSDHDRDILDRVRDSAAWQAAEAERDAERAKRHAGLVRERKALLAETDRIMAQANEAHLAALAAEEELAAKLKAAKAKRLEAERAAYDLSMAASRRLAIVEGDLRDTADPAIAAARDWARNAFNDGTRGYQKQPGRRVVKEGIGRLIEVPKVEEFRAALEHVGMMGRPDSGPLWELELSDLPAAKVAERVAELKAEGERLILEAISNEGTRGPVRRVVETLRKVTDVHEARRAARRAAAGEVVEAGA